MASGSGVAPPEHLRATAPPVARISKITKSIHVVSGCPEARLGLQNPQDRKRLACTVVYYRSGEAWSYTTESTTWVCFPETANICQYIYGKSDHYYLGLCFCLLRT